MNKTITVNYGPDKLTKSVDAGYTVGHLKDDDAFRTALGYGDNIVVLIGGVAQGDHTVIPTCAEVKIETAANQKAN
jgi:hypothetical protein